MWTWNSHDATRCSALSPCSQDVHSLVWGTQITWVTNEEPVEVLEKGIACAKSNPGGISQVAVTRENLRQGRGDGEALWESLSSHRWELKRLQLSWLWWEHRGSGLWRGILKYESLGLQLWGGWERDELGVSLRFTTWVLQWWWCSLAVEGGVWWSCVSMEGECYFSMWHLKVSHSLQNRARLKAGHASHRVQLFLKEWIQVSAVLPSGKYKGARQFSQITCLWSECFIHLWKVMEQFLGVHWSPHPVLYKDM